MVEDSRFFKHDKRKICNVNAYLIYLAIRIPVNLLNTINVCCII